MHYLPLNRGDIVIHIVCFVPLIKILFSTLIHVYINKPRCHIFSSYISFLNSTVILYYQETIDYQQCYNNLPCTCVSVDTVKLSRSEIIQSMCLFASLWTIAQMLPRVKKTNSLPWVLNCIPTWWQFLHYLLLFQCYLSTLFIDIGNPTLSYCWLLLWIILFSF